MALECQGLGDSFAENCVGSPCEKEVSLSAASLPVPFTNLKPSYTKKSKNKSAAPKTVLPFVPLKRGVSRTGITLTDETSPNADTRSFTDLPPALVSEVLHRLEPKELGIVSCVSTLLNSLASEHHGWKDFYNKRWGLPVGLNAPNLPSSQNAKSWKELFVEREFRSKSFMGRYSVDSLHGLTEAVRVVFLLQPAKLIFTGGYDMVVRMWDMEDVFSISVSRSLGCTIRAIAADTQLLVAAGTDAFLQCWRAAEGHPHLFDIAGSLVDQNNDFRLWGHEGPVTCLALDSSKIYSGSWDMSIRVWDRTHLKCLWTLRHGDWIWAISPRGNTVACTAGRDVYLWDVENGHPLSIIHNAHIGNAYSLTRSYLGDLLFTGGEDGAIHMFEVRDDCDDDVKPSATWVPHSGPVNSLAFEFPWLVSSSSDGRIALIDVRRLLTSAKNLSSGQHSQAKKSSPNVMEPPQRMLHGAGCNLLSVDIGADRIVCGGEERVVRIWNFSEALEIEKRVQALRKVRQENKMRRRKSQMEMNGSIANTDQCSLAAKRNQLNGYRQGVWRVKRSTSGKLKA